MNLSDECVLLDLFAGLALFSRAARNVYQDKFRSAGFVEIDPYCQKQILQEFPNEPIHGDINTYFPDRKEIQPTIITAGFPCTDVSIATPVRFNNKKDRIHGTRSGLWKHITRISRILRPPFIILENSSNIIHAGLGEIITGFSEIGYGMVWRIISAQEFGLPHLRNRWYALCADTSYVGFNEIQVFCSIFDEELQKTRSKALTRLESEFGGLACGRTFREDYGKFLQMDNEYTAKDNERDIRAVGNAIIPDIAELFFKSIKRMEEL